MLAPAPVTLPPDPAGSPAPRRPRLAALDAARALGVLAMVCGHTLDAVLSAEARQTPGMLRYWAARGFTAPLFLLVSGWAVTLAISRSGATGWAVPRGRLRRVLLLLVIGYALRWPGWWSLFQGSRQAWTGFLAFDALHCIAISILVTALVLALPAPRAAKAALLGGLAACAAIFGTNVLMPGAVEANGAALPYSVPVIALVQAVGGYSSFPLLPWAAYFFAGAILGLLAPPDRRGVLGMAVTAAATIVVTVYWAGLGNRQPGDPVLIAYRVGVVLAVLSALSLVPARWAALAAPLGKSSLGVYALHLPIVYGWNQFTGLDRQVGRTLDAGGAIGLAVLVLAGCFVATRLLSLGKRRANELLHRPRPQA